MVVDLQIGLGFGSFSASEVEATIDAVRHILNDRVNSYLTCEK